MTAVLVGPADLVPWLLDATGPEGELVARVAVNEAAEAADGTVTMRGSRGRFAVEARWTPLATAIHGWDVAMDLTVDGDEALDASIAIAVQLPVDEDPAWLVPAVFYGENRSAQSRAHHPRWVADRIEANGDPFASPEWWFRADRCSIPAVLATAAGLRVAVATREMSPVGQAGVGFGTVETPDGPRRELRLSFPYRELPVVYDGSAEALPPDRPTHRWHPGETITLTARVYAVPAGRNASGRILRDLHDWLAAGPPLEPAVSVDEAATLAADGLLRWHDRPADGVLIETAAFLRVGKKNAVEPGDRLAMHVAWLSGAPAAYALLLHGLRTRRSDAVDAARRVLDGIASNLAPCGTFWGQWTADRGWTKGWTPGRDALHARTLAEATLFMIRAAALTGDAAWRTAAASNVAFVAECQRADGSIPSAWNGRTGAPLAWAGTAGLAWVPALVEAGQLLGDRALLGAARHAGRRYARDVEAERLAGAPEDVDLAPTSEDGYVALMAYVALARSADEGDRPGWLPIARHAADWMLSFRYAYDVDLPADGDLARIGFRSRGADMASPANQHLHVYGLICTSELLELARLARDPWYAERAIEAFDCARQVIVREDGELGGLRGMMPERLFQTRYVGPKGSVGRLSHAWCLGLLLNAAELAARVPELGTRTTGLAGG